MTNYHCCEKNIYRTKIRDSKNNSYWANEICQIDRDEDLALVKSDIRKNCEPRLYKFFNTNNIKFSYNLFEFPVCLKTRWNGNIKDYFGSLLCGEVPSIPGKDKNQFSMDINLIKGDSGGIVISSEGGLIGFATSSKSYSYGSKIYSALNLIQEEINLLKYDPLNAVKRRLKFSFINSLKHLVL